MNASKDHLARVKSLCIALRGAAEITDEEARLLDWLVGGAKRLQRFEAMWEDCRQHRDRAEARARRYMEMMQQVAAIVAPDEE